MRALILAAGIGSRLQPLSDLCAKPAMPVRGIPVIAHTLTWLAKHDVSEVVINLHHLPNTVRDAVERHLPPGMEVHYSHETKLLGTGGGMKAVADFLRESDPSLVVSGDMLVDFDLKSAVARHRERDDGYTLVCAGNHPLAERFGTLGFDAEGCLVRIGKRFDIGGEVGSGLFLGVRIVAARTLEGWPDADDFEDLTDWWGPKLRSGSRDVHVESIATQDLLWQPVGTAEEYWAANFQPPPLSYGDEVPGEALAEHVQTGGGMIIDSIVGKGARIADGASLERVVVWPDETVDGNVRAADGVFADGRFVSCRPQSD